METIIIIAFILLTYRFVWLYGVMPTAKMTYRDKLFELRTELFEFMVENKIDFDTPSYRKTRELINSYIRYADKVTFFQILTGYYISKKFNVLTEKDSILSELIEDKDSELSKKISLIMVKIAVFTLIYIVSINLILLMLSLIIVPALFIFYAAVGFTAEKIRLKRSEFKKKAQEEESIEYTIIRDVNIIMFKNSDYKEVMHQEMAHA